MKVQTLKKNLRTMIHHPHPVQTPAHILIMQILKKEFLVIKILDFLSFISINIIILI